MHTSFVERKTTECRQKKNSFYFLCVSTAFEASCNMWYTNTHIRNKGESKKNGVYQGIFPLTPRGVVAFSLHVNRLYTYHWKNIHSSGGSFA